MYSPACFSLWIYLSSFISRATVLPMDCVCFGKAVGTALLAHRDHGLRLLLHQRWLAVLLHTLVPHDVGPRVAEHSRVLPVGTGDLRHEGALRHRNHRFAFHYLQRLVNARRCKKQTRWLNGLGQASPFARAHHTTD